LGISPRIRAAVDSAMPAIKTSSSLAAQCWVIVEELLDFARCAFDFALEMRDRRLNQGHYGCQNHRRSTPISFGNAHLHEAMLTTH
jgi:hypothetical protein